MALRQGEAGAPIEEICRKMGLSVGMQWELRRAVGAQWELRRALARTDQRLGHYDASMRAHVQRRFPPGERPSGSFSNEHRQQPFRIEIVDAKEERMKSSRPDRMPRLRDRIQGVRPWSLRATAPSTLTEPVRALARSMKRITI